MQNPTPVKMGSSRYLEKLSELMANDVGFRSRTVTQAKMKDRMGPKNLCRGPYVSKK